MPRPVRRSLLALFAIGVGLVAIFGLFTAFPMPEKPVLFIRNDHLLHVCAFSFLALTGLLLWAPAALMVALLVASAGALELVQHFFPAHQTSLVDWGFSSSGVALGAILFLLMSALIRSVQRCFGR